MISRQHLTSATALLLSSLLNHGAIEAQTITITFEATLNGTSVPLDSVLVENLDAGGDTTIYYPDNLLYLVGTGVEEAPFGDGQFHSIPNPFLYTTDIIVTSTKGEMLIAIHDPLGREVAVQRMVASPGQHQFRYTCGMPGIHFVSVLQNDNHRVVRLLALDGGIAQKGTLSYLGMDGIVKADRALFIWNPGDQLRYTGA